jgi:hypothetical protein
MEFFFSRGTQLRSLLRHYATSRKVVGSKPNEVIGFFNLPNPHYGPGVDSAANNLQFTI